MSKNKVVANMKLGTDPFKWKLGQYCSSHDPGDCGFSVLENERIAPAPERLRTIEDLLSQEIGIREMLGMVTQQAQATLASICKQKRAWWRAIEKDLQCDVTDLKISYDRRGYIFKTEVQNEE